MWWNSSRTIQIPKRWWFCIHYPSKSRRPRSGHRTGKGQSSFQFPRRAVPKHWTIALTSHASKVMLKIVHARLQHYLNQEIPDVQAGFRKGRGTRDQIANIRWIIEKSREFQRNICICFIDYTKTFVWIMTNHGKPLERWEYQTISPVSWETCILVKKQQLEPCMEHLIGSRWGKELNLFPHPGPQLAPAHR